MKDNTHFDKIFWFIVGNTTVVLVYVFAITFCHVPKENLRFVDVVLGFLLGSIVSSCISYLIGGTSLDKKGLITPPAGITTATIDATITNSPEVDPDKQNDK